MSTKKDYTDFSVYLSSITLGLLMGAYNVGGLWSIVFTGVGIVGACVETIYKHNPYRRLFENCGITVDDQPPRYLGRTKTSYGYVLGFTLPAGLSTDDFERKRLAIEQYLGSRIDITYKNKRVYIKVYEKELKDIYKYTFTQTTKPCEFPIGYTHGEKLITIDLERVVHLLIAGETGSGKSTLLRSILTNLVLDKDPDKVSLHLIDLKNGAEFNVFRKCSIVKSFSRNLLEAERVLSKMNDEVDRRYDMFYKSGVVNIQEYNKKHRHKKLDYQIVVVDEFASLQNEKDSISTIETLAAKARACGIHLIISTQRPDAKILNGRIKANVPCVIGLKTTNDVNSRIIIGEGGLDELRGKGHGILKYSDTTEFQSLFLTTQRARSLIKSQYVESESTSLPIEKQNKYGEVDGFDFLERLK